MERMNGTVAVDHRQGCGLIAARDATEYFFRRFACTGARFDELREGQVVSFEVGHGAKGPRAENVREQLSRRAA